MKFGKLQSSFEILDARSKAVAMVPHSSPKCARSLDLALQQNTSTCNVERGTRKEL